MKRGGSKAASERVVRPRSPSTHKSDVVKVCGWRPHDGGAAHTGAGVRKPPREETAGGVRGWRGVGYGDLSAADEVCEWSRGAPASWRTVKRLPEERRVASITVNCRTICDVGWISERALPWPIERQRA